jgi:hypothetical protein
MSEQNGQLLTLSNKPNKSKKVNNMNTVILGKDGTNRESAVSLLVQALSPAKEFFNLQFFRFYERGEFFDSRFSCYPPQGFS